MTSTVRANMAKQEKEKKVAKRLSENPVVVELVGVSSKNEHSIKDDTSTPANEAWVEKPKAVKKTAAKKKTTAKKGK